VSKPVIRICIGFYADLDPNPKVWLDAGPDLSFYIRLKLLKILLSLWSVRFVVLEVQKKIPSQNDR